MSFIASTFCGEITATTSQGATKQSKVHDYRLPGVF
jgi:hypothetical protein